MTELIQAVPVVRDADGTFFHPGMPDFDEGDGDLYKAWLKAQELEVTHANLESENGDHPVYIAYFENGESSHLEWNPAPPEGEGWFTLAIGDTEDGPIWTWARRAGAQA